MNKIWRFFAILNNTGSVPTLTPKDPGDFRIIKGIKGGGVVIPLSAVRPCRRRVPPKGPWMYLKLYN
jgi:hypothetical protein